MTNEERETIGKLRLDGLSYGQIAAALGISVNTVKSFCRRHDASKLLCKNCGKSLEQVVGKKPKTFCSDWCRNAWWKSHRNAMRKKAVYTLYCARCGRRFDSYGNKSRKYCSHECYIRDRFDPP
jgi:transposase